MKKILLFLLLPSFLLADDYCITNKQIVIRQLKSFCLTQHWKYTDNLLVEVYDSAWLASKNNPTWGPRILITCKLIVVQVKESPGFNRKALYVNKDGSLDVGSMQINSCNWFGSYWWERYCKKRKYKSNDFGLLFNRYFNLAYAAWLNERFIENRLKQYRYYEKPEQKELYDSLIKSLGIECLAEKYNDGQYKVKTNGQ